ncbi:MAG TPA: RNA-binding domain-containing protein [Kofleriaceae bacterium]|nr:RNA-binding domain-containing protein [Kofleriaceae bacterium]
MPPTLAELTKWLADRESEHLEFKEAKNSYDTEKLVRYCSALANEGGGRMVLGVSDRRPRRVVGTTAYGNPEKIAQDLLNRLHLRIEISEIQHPEGRVIVFTVPSRPIGMPVAVDGAYWMRSGESLVAMTPDLLKRIFEEGVPDFSAAVCPGASINDLSVEALMRFRDLVGQRVSSTAQEFEGLLEDVELSVDGGITYAALILLGSKRALGRFLPQAEILFEYRVNEDSIQYAQREELREGFLLVDSRLWLAIEQHNTIYQLIDGFFRRDIPSFNTLAVREAVLNAVCHRDYRLQGSIFIRQSPRRLQVSSPGGFPPGITVDNILFRQAPRNRRLAEAFGRCGLVERSGQGADLLFATAVREGKQPLDYAGSDAFQVHLALHGGVEDEGFLKYLEQATADTSRSLSTHELVVLNAVRRERPVPEAAKGAVSGLVDRGLIERAGKGRYVLARKYHRLVGRPADYTRKAGLSRPHQKALLVKHLEENEGSQLAELCDVLPNLTTKQVQTLLAELKKEGAIHSVGRTRAGRWYVGSSPKLVRQPG